MAMTDRTKAPLGKLEQQIMDVLWTSGATASVRDVCEALRDRRLAYTTVMTTLDRLFRKGILQRERQSGAYLYHPVLTRDEHERSLVEGAVSELLAHSADNVLAAFVDLAVKLDDENLDRLERLLEKRRRE